MIKETIVFDPTVLCSFVLPHGSAIVLTPLFYARRYTPGNLALSSLRKMISENLGRC